MDGIGMRAGARSRRAAVGLVALVAGATLGLVACGGDDEGSDGAGGLGPGGDGGDAGGGLPGSGSGGGDVDVCGLLEVAEIEAQFGDIGPVSEGSPEDMGAVTGCSWDVGDPMGTGTDYAVVGIGYSTQDAELTMDAVTGDPVEGLGDEAILSSDSNLYIREGDTFLNVIVTTVADVPNITEKVTTLAHAAIDRL